MSGSSVGQPVGGGKVLYLSCCDAESCESTYCRSFGGSGHREAGGGEI